MGGVPRVQEEVLLQDRWRRREHQPDQSDQAVQPGSERFQIEQNESDYSSTDPCRTSHSLTLSCRM